MATTSSMAACSSGVASHITTPTSGSIPTTNSRITPSRYSPLAKSRRLATK